MTQKRNLLVTGGAGFIGSNYVHYWARKYPEHQLVVLDSLTYAGNKSNLNDLIKNDQIQFVHGNILDETLVKNLLTDAGLDTIVHFAAESHVDRSIHGPDEFLKTNIEGTHSLLKAAKAVWLDEPHTREDHRFHHVSTDEVYGTLEPDMPAFTEQNQYLPNSPYAASKAGADHIVRSYQHTYGLKTTISNCSNNYGPYQFPEKLIPLIISNCLDGKELPIYGDGKQIRDWLYVDDHNLAIDKIIHYGAIDNVYNIGGNNEWTNIDIVTQICQIMDEVHPQGKPHSDLITYVTDRAGHDRRYAINASKIEDEMGYQPIETFKTGIRKTVQWYIDNESWWRKIMEGSYQDWIKQNYATK